MFIAALFTIAKIWKQPKCPSTHKWIKKVWYGILLSGKKKRMKSCCLPWIDLEGVMLREISQTEKDKYPNTI